jgi:hydrogenase nickel incorporation protein HypA/HybF
MHELSVASAIVDTVNKHAAGRKVTSIQLRIGQLRQVVPDSLAFYFEHVAAGTDCEGARLEIEAIPAHMNCDDCDGTWALNDTTLFRCPTCGSASVRVTDGEELEVETIEVEDQEKACIA